MPLNLTVDLSQDADGGFAGDSYTIPYTRVGALTDPWIFLHYSTLKSFLHGWHMLIVESCTEQRTLKIDACSRVTYGRCSKIRLHVAMTLR